MPDHCLVRGAMNQRTGIDGQPYALQFELRFPTDWNKRFYYQCSSGVDGVLFRRSAPIAAAVMFAMPFWMVLPLSPRIQGMRRLAIRPMANSCLEPILRHVWNMAICKFRRSRLLQNTDPRLLWAATQILLLLWRQRRLNLNRTSDGSGGRLYVACGSVISRQTAIASVRSVW